MSQLYQLREEPFVSGTRHRYSESLSNIDGKDAY